MSQKSTPLEYGIQVYLSNTKTLSYTLRGHPTDIPRTNRPFHGICPRMSVGAIPWGCRAEGHFGRLFAHGSIWGEGRSIPPPIRSGFALPPPEVASLPFVLRWPARRAGGVPLVVSTFGHSRYHSTKKRQG